MRTSQPWKKLTLSRCVCVKRFAFVPHCDGLHALPHCRMGTATWRAPCPPSWRRLSPVSAWLRWPSESLFCRQKIPPPPPPHTHTHTHTHKADLILDGTCPCVMFQLSLQHNRMPSQSRCWLPLAGISVCNVTYAFHPQPGQCMNCAVLAACPQLDTLRFCST